LGIIAPYLRKSKDIWVGAITGISLSALVMCSLVIFSIGIFTVIGASRLTFPTYAIATLVTFGEFFQRIESLFVFVWFFSASISLTVLFHMTCLSTAQVLELPEYKPLIWPISVIVFVFSFLPSNIVQVFHLDFTSLGRVYGGGILLLPVGLYIWSIIFKKGRKGW
jgi:hypothetical protein